MKEERVKELKQKGVFHFEEHGQNLVIRSK